MSGYRHRFAESLDDWAESHGEPVDNPGPFTPRCATHGDYEGDPCTECPECVADADDFGQRIRRRRDREDIADAEYTYPYTLGD